MEVKKSGDVLGDTINHLYCTELQSLIQSGIKYIHTGVFPQSR